MRIRFLFLVAALALTPCAARGADGASPPYDDDLLRLAEILGCLHYLRPLCGAGGEAQRWRDEMAVLIETERPSDARKAKLIGAFNRGYTSFSEVYRTCTPAARAAVARQMDEGARLSHEIVVRYGGN